MLKKFYSILIIFIILIGITVTAVYAVNTRSTDESEENISNAETSGEYEVMPINEPIAEETQKQADNNKGFGLIAVALSTGLACIGAGIAVATVGSSSVGAISENPKLLGKTIIFVGLAEGIAIYGLIISIMILNEI